MFDSYTIPFFSLELCQCECKHNQAQARNPKAWGFITTRSGLPVLNHLHKTIINSPTEFEELVMHSVLRAEDGMTLIA